MVSPIRLPPPGGVNPPSNGLSVPIALIVDPLVPISITSNTRYALQIVAPGELFFNAFLMRAEFSLPNTEESVGKTDFSFWATSDCQRRDP